MSPLEPVPPVDRALLRPTDKPKIVSLMRTWATVAALWLCGIAGASAQSGDWLVLPTTVANETEWMPPTVDALARELRTQGVGVWTPHRAATAFDARGSMPATEVSEERIQAWADASENALRLLSTAQLDAALGELEEAHGFSRSVLETLNRKPDRAPLVLDTCLYLVRARLDSGDERGAARQVEECVRMVPNTEPSGRMHPPQVLALYRNAKKPKPGRAGNLRVESDPPRCPLRLNGVLVGKTPIELTGLYPGEYRAQLECQAELEGRVHVVDVPAGGTSLFIFDRFDRAVRSSPFLHLQYEEQPDSKQITVDARQVARALPAVAVVVASMPNAETLELRLVSPTQLESTLVRVETASTGPTRSLADGVSALLARRCTDLTGDEAVAIDCYSGEPVEGRVDEATVADTKRPSRRRPRGQFVSGLTLVSLGSASLLSTYGVLIARKRAGDDWIDEPNSLGSQDQWLRLGTGLIATGAGGAGLAVAGMPLLLPERRRTPWWAWLSGGLGLVATAGAIASAATAAPKPDRSCAINGPDPTPCVDRERDTDRAFVLGMTAAPLLTVPLVYLLRRGGNEPRTAVQPALAAGREGALVSVRGAF